ncbi:MAG: hypothetical protein ABJF88_12210 [Rhodothermales bacterium]
MPSLHRIKAQAASAAWLLSALMLFAPLGAHAVGAVLCIEADGEVAVERSEGAACAEGADEHVPLGTTHCDPCTDLPLPSGGDTDCASFKTESGPSAQTVLSVVALLPASDRAPTPSPAASPLQDGRGALPPDPALSRSVVLLI